jgi:hypothetical protein
MRVFRVLRVLKSSEDNDSIWKHESVATISTALLVDIGCPKMNCWVFLGHAMLSSKEKDRFVTGNAQRPLANVSFQTNN